ncbi:hypothetical protein EDB19DRAFT_1794238 [Suillus lakei]|nr:hypothetical protein EDB19DRAFT_1794238 [Suillus lakei]
MRLSFVVVLAAQLATLEAAMSVRSDSKCVVACGSTKDCCKGHKCAKVYIGKSDSNDVSMSAFHPVFNPMTHRCGRHYTSLSVLPSELQ